MRRALLINELKISKLKELGDLFRMWKGKKKLLRFLPHTNTDVDSRFRINIINF